MARIVTTTWRETRCKQCRARWWSEVGKPIVCPGRDDYGKPCGRVPCTCAECKPQ